MAPSTSLRSRIAAFESGAVVNPDPESPVRENGENAPNNSDSAALELMDQPISPTAQTFTFLKPSAAQNQNPTPPISRSHSPETLGGGASLIDVSELEGPAARAPQPQLPARPMSVASKTQTNTSSRDSTSSFDVSRFSFDAASSRSTDSHAGSPATTSPPLPPRKPTFLQNGSSSSSIPQSRSTSSGAETADSISSSWYKVPQLSGTQFLDVQSAFGGETSRRGHSQKLSTSSFQSVSLSSDGEQHEPEDEPVTTPSVSDAIAAFNKQAAAPQLAKSASGAPLPYVPRKPPPRSRDTSPATPTGTTHAPLSPVAKPTPPPLPARKPTAPPNRPYNTASASSSQQSVPSLSIRRVAPPPLYPTQPHNSSASPSTSRNASSSSVERRKAPIPPAARKRFETLFDKNVERRPSRLSSPSRTPLSSSGWRGADATFGTDESEGGRGGSRMSGTLVKSIWSCSRLPSATLRIIWMDCDPNKTGSLDREAFVRGTWAIDMELAKAAKGVPRRQR